jgi:hypothetical protein
LRPWQESIRVSTGRNRPQKSSWHRAFVVRSISDSQNGGRLYLPHRFEWDSSAAYVGRLFVGIPAYTRVDTRFGWKMNEYLDFSITGQNLLTPRHAEFQSVNGLNYTLVERTVFGKITWRFETVRDLA